MKMLWLMLTSIYSKVICVINESIFYVINLDKSTTRFEKFKNTFDPLELTISKISAVDGNSIDFKVFSNDIECRREMGRSIQPGEVGCFLSHRKALENFLKTDSEYALIFEDDAVPTAQFKDVVESLTKSFLKEKKNVIAINLGATDFKYSSPYLNLGSHTLRCTHRFPMLATCVLWTRYGANLFIKNSSKVTMPYDNFLRYLFSGTNRVFSVQPPVISGSGDDSDIKSRNLSNRRSGQNRSQFYFFIKQYRNIRYKLRAIRAFIRWLFYKK